MGQLSRLEGRETCAASKKRVSADCEIATTRSAENCQSNCASVLCRLERLRRPLCHLPSARAEAPRCRSHRHGYGRAVRTAGRLEWPAVNEDHHAAFDAHLIGIDPDFRIHVSDRLLDLHDGPFLELGLKGIAGTQIEMPRRAEDRPDRDRLALRFELFKSLHNGVDKS
jgi:hypothetical protein